MCNGRKRALRKLSRKLGVALPRDGRNRSNRRKQDEAVASGQTPSVIIRRRRRRRKRFAGRRDKGR